MNARLNISKTVSEDEAFEVYLTHLLDTIVSKGDAQETSSLVNGTGRLPAVALHPLSTIVHLAKNRRHRSSGRDDAAQSRK